MGSVLKTLLRDLLIECLKSEAVLLIIFLVGDILSNKLELVKMAAEHSFQVY